MTVALADLDQTQYWPLDAQDYAEIHTFFLKIAGEKYAYKAAMARRCFNLCTYFAQMEKIEDLNRNVISQNALLLYAEDIAEAYHKNGRFPDILLFDEVLLYGRALSNVLYTLEELVFYYLQINHSDCSVNRYRVHCDLVSAVDIWVYAMSENAYTVENSYLYKVKAKRRRSDNRILQLSQSISAFLLNAGKGLRTANTSFMPSIQKKALAGFVPDESWKHITWERSLIKLETSDEYYIRFLKTSDFSLTQAVQVESQWVTGIALFDRMSLTQINEYCKTIVDYLSAINLPSADRLKRILCMNSDFLIDQKAQFLVFFLSVLCLYDFVGAIKPDVWKTVIRQSSDIDKIAANFAKPGEIVQALHLLCEDTRFMALLRERLQGTFVELGDADIPVSAKNDVQTCAEDIFCQAGMASDIEAYKYGHNLKLFSPLSVDSNLVFLEDYRARMRDALWRAGRLPQTNALDDTSLSCVLFLAHSGVTSVLYKADREKGSVTLAFKAGELSTYALPVRFLMFLPAISLVEQRCWRINRKPQDAVKQFIAWLPPAQCSTQEERDLLRQLKEKWPPYQDALYACRKRIERWSILWVDHAPKTREEKELRARQIYFWQKAREFLHL